MITSRRLSLLLLPVFALNATTAFADWQYTHWGMTKEQVIAASKGQAVTLTPDEQAKQSTSDHTQSALLKVPYSSGQFAFTAYFRFDNATGGLVDVHLVLTEGANQGSSLMGALRSKYGKPQSEDDGLVQLAVWYEAGDQISYVNVGGHMVSVDYRARNDADNRGL